MAAVKNSERNSYNSSSENFIPVVCHYDQHTLLTKNGELLQTIQINGINAEKISEDLFNLRQVVRDAISQNINCSKYAFWLHTIRRKADLSDDTPYHNLLAANINNIWTKKNYWDDKYVNCLYITIIHNGPELKIKNFTAAVNSLFYKTITKFEQNFFQRAAANLTELADSILTHLSNYGAQKLGLYEADGAIYSEPMFLYRRIMQLSEEPCELTESDISLALASHQYALGSDKMEVIGNEGKKFAAILAIKEYQEVSAAALDRFLQLPVEMIATEIFYFVTQKEILPQFERANYVLQVSKDEKLRQLKELDQITQKDNSDIRFCHQHITCMIIGNNVQNLDEQVMQASKALARIGIVHTKVDIDLEKTFWAQLPANFAFLPKMKPTILGNTAALASLHNFPTGSQYSPWGRALTLLRTELGTPYFTNFHDHQDKGATCVFGTTQSGRTTLVNFLLSEADKYQPTIIYLCDDMDSAIYIKAREGRWFQRDQRIINPLLCDDTHSNHQYLVEFFKIIANHYFDPLAGELIAVITNLVSKILADDKEKRILSQYINELDEADEHSLALKKRLANFGPDGTFNKIFERDDIPLRAQDILAFNLQAFDDNSYVQQYYPKEKKLLPKFEYELNSRRAIKAAIVLAAKQLLIANNNGPKILVIDNMAELLHMHHYPHLIKAIAADMHQANGILLSSVNNKLLQQLYKQNIDRSWIDIINTSFILPSDVAANVMAKILDLSPAETDKLANLQTNAHNFLMRQSDKTIATELSIGGLQGIVKLLVATKKTRYKYFELIKNHGSEVEQWLEPLYLELDRNE